VHWEGQLSFLAQAFHQPSERVASMRISLPAMRARLLHAQDGFDKAEIYWAHNSFHSTQHLQVPIEAYTQWIKGFLAAGWDAYLR
jgi:hypothetical protein